MSLKTLHASNAALRERDRIFAAVFPPISHTIPTPRSSPYIGGPSSPNFDDDVKSPAQTSERDFTRAQAAWSTVTRWLLLSRDAGNVPSELDEALDLLAREQGGTGRDAEKLLEWLGEEVRIFCADSIAPRLTALWSTIKKTSQSRGALTQTLSVLSPAQDHVLRRLDLWLEADTHEMQLDGKQMDRRDFVMALRRHVLRQLHGAVQQDLPPKKFSASLRVVLRLTLDALGNRNDKAPELLDLLTRLARVGLCGDGAQRILAEVVQLSIERYVRGAEMRVDWVEKRSRAGHLRDWISETLQPAALQCLRAISDDEDIEFQTTDRNQWQRLALSSLGQTRQENLLSYVQLWPASLGAILDLKEYIALPGIKQHLAQDFSQQMIDRIGHAGVTTTQLLGIYVNVIRAFKTLDNRSVLLERVAQPLRQYLRERDDTVRVIAASFLAQLDENQALAPGSGSLDDVCVDITREVLRSEEESAAPQSSVNLDWDDMNWLPDPIDAGPDYRSTKNNDVISYMLTLFERDAFIAEIQNILGERLLRSSTADLASETRLVETLKTRLGGDKLQSAEVMVRDMADSARLRKLIASNAEKERKLPTVREMYRAIPAQGITFGELVDKMALAMPSNPHLKAKFIAVVKEAAMPGPEGRSHLLYRNERFVDTEDEHEQEEPVVEDFEVKILSSFFWPQLRDDEFRVPQAVSKAQREYEAGFKRIKSLRRLNWLSALGRATVEVELKDRTVKVEGVKTWIAAVVYEFHDKDEEADAMDIEDHVPVKRSAAELEEALGMDEVLVRSALAFWVGQRVLRDKDDDNYEVLETLDQDAEDIDGDEIVGQPSAPTRAVDEGVSALKSQDALLKANKPLYEMFMIGMLTNGGAMDAGRVAMMLKMVVPGGFNYGEDEVVWLLQGMEQEGKVEKRGDAWAVKK